ncbi:hypothetical protein TPY_0601 [Sulfobacillus acidophilus TPY]|uniref:DUF4321 domain-containing protein n=1 Tax=Sulfobacillus acidophilus (strain ATCC 700253 / DSM 10332 / NAL) TaxID=679936 RepID=G8U0F1_SULAD|nr:hypothetical protein TPY_0601 [Sulfobacillus acidophilus TPY]AEW06493.1 hypothetical protein Sulac_3036 [Sulfobacillus acidophilus DSM 10332]MCY0863467.1 DUF4321 domain-containing protein [Sulfobacillus sp.]
MRRQRQGFWMTVVYIVLGGLIGSAIGHWLSPLWSPFGSNLVSLGTTPGTVWTINLGVLGVQIGAWLDVNLVGLIGMLAGLMWSQRQRS